MFILALPHIGLAFRGNLVLLWQLSFSLPSASKAKLKRSELAHGHRTKVCINSSNLWILLDINLDVDITTNNYVNLHNPNKWKLTLRNKNTAFTLIQIILHFFIPTTATIIMWEVEVRTAAGVLKPQFCMLNKTLFFFPPLYSPIFCSCCIFNYCASSPQISSAGFMVSLAQCESMLLLQSNWNNTNTSFWINVQGLVTKIKNSYKGGI